MAGTSDKKGKRRPLADGTTSIGAADSPSIDAFGRWRVSDPETIFDSKQLHDNQPLFWDDQEESGGSTTSTHSTATASTTMGVGATTAGKRTRQTFRRFNYQPGKSQLIFCTGVLDKSGGGTGITRGFGYYDDDNGLYLEDKEGTINFVRRTKTSGVVVNNRVAQSSWNLDTMDGTGASGITLDFSKTQILIIDFEWLGVGRARMGFVVDGKIYYAHEFNNANNLSVVYMSTPNLPLRYQIENDGNGAASTLEHICSSVISEGGTQDNGQVRYASTANTQINAAVVGTVYAIKGIRLKSTALDETIKILNASVQIQSASDEFEWLLYFKPTLSSTATWNNETNSSVQTATGTGLTISAGTIIAGGYIASGSAQNAAADITQEIKNALLLGSAIDGTPDQIWLAGRPLTNVNTLVEGSLTWRELL